tara:strand:+ start:4423 stop:6957 length:2535 start_codon:yes stop_codon:yes gene_type:complete
MSTEDSFFNNPTVQSILSRRGEDDRDDTKDFLLSLILNGGISFFQGFNQALPNARAEAIQGVKDNINIALDDNKTMWLDKSAQRQQYQVFKDKGGFEALTKKDNWLATDLENEYATNIFPTHEKVTEFGSGTGNVTDFNVAKRTSANFRNGVDEYVAERLQEEIKKYKAFEQDKYISTSSVAQLNQDVRREMAAELMAARELPTNAYEAVWNKMKDVFGKKEAAVINNEANLNIASVDASKKKTAIDNSIYNADSIDLSKFNTNYDDSEASIALATKNSEEKLKLYESLVKDVSDTQVYQKMKFDVPATSAVTVDDNGSLVISDNAPIGRKNVKINNRFNLRNMEVQRYNPNTREYETINVNPKSQFIDSTSTLISIYQDEFGQAGLSEATDIMYQDAVEAFMATGHLTHNGDNLVFKIPRKDTSYKSLTYEQLQSGNKSDLLNYALTERSRQENAVTLTPDALYDNFVNEQIQAINRGAAGRVTLAGGIDEFDQLMITKDKLLNLDGVERAKGRLQFLFNPPEGYKDSQVKVGDSIFKLSEMNQETAQLLLDDLQTATGESYESLQKLVDGLPTVKQQTEDMPPLPETEGEGEATPSEDLAEDIQKNLTGNALRAQRLRESREAAQRTGNVDFDFVAQEEGFRTDMYVPLDNEGNVFGSSGPTIGTGVDLGQMNENDLVKTGVSKELIEKLSPYLGMKKDEALKFVQENPLSLSEGEALEISKAVQAVKINRIANTFEEKTGKSFGDLNPRVKTIVVSTGFQYGENGIPTFMQLAADTIGNETRESFTALQNELLNFADSDKDGITDFLPRRTRESEYLQSLIDNIFVPKTRKQSRQSLLSQS